MYHWFDMYIADHGSLKSKEVAVEGEGGGEDAKMSELDAFKASPLRRRSGETVISASVQRPCFGVGGG